MLFSFLNGGGFYSVIYDAKYFGCENCLQAAQDALFYDKDSGPVQDRVRGDSGKGIDQ